MVLVLIFVLLQLANYKTEGQVDSFPKINQPFTNTYFSGGFLPVPPGGFFAYWNYNSFTIEIDQTPTYQMYYMDVTKIVIRLVNKDIESICEDAEFTRKELLEKNYEVIWCNRKLNLETKKCTLGEEKEETER